MNYALQHLAHLVQVKNELNRKRRRFYCINNNFKRIDVSVTTTPSYRWEYKYVKHKAFTRTFAKKQYKLAQKQMKEMTAKMKELKKHCGAKLVWGGSGNIKAIRVGDDWYELKDIARQAELYTVDRILLGD